MAEEKQPPGVVEGATTGDVEDELQDDQAKSAEDRKAAAALSKLDARDDDVAGSASVDQEGLSKAMNKLSVSKAAAKTEAKKVKVDAADVTLLVSLAEQVGTSEGRGGRCWEGGWNGEFTNTRRADTFGAVGRRTRFDEAEGYRAAEAARRRCGHGDEGFYCGQLRRGGYTYRLAATEPRNIPGGEVALAREREVAGCVCRIHCCLSEHFVCKC